MIEPLTLKKHSLHFLAEFICEKEQDYDFYFTNENSRHYITDLSSLKKFIKQSNTIFVCRDDKMDFQGLVLLWKSSGGGISRYYIKLFAINERIAEKLLIVLIWNSTTDIYAKFRRDNRFLPLLKNKGFRFQASRGAQLLLHRKFVPMRKKYDSEE